MRKLLLILLLSVPSMAQTLSLTQSGSGNAAQIAVTISGHLKYVWSAADNWGMDQLYDLEHDPSATKNVIGPSYGVNGASDPCGDQAGIGNTVFYSDGDRIQFMHYVNTGCLYPSATRSMQVITNTPSLVVLESSQTPTSPSSMSTLSTTKMRWYIYPNGQIYISNLITAATNYDMSQGSGDHVINISIPQSVAPNVTAWPDPENMGWVRASKNYNPYGTVYVGTMEPYEILRWGTANTDPNYTKVSFLIVPSPASDYSGTGQLFHGWSYPGNAGGVIRWGYIKHNGPNLSAGQSVRYDYMIQIGIQGSSVLPSMAFAPPTLCAVCDTIANAYIADPAPPGAAGLLSGMTPNNYVVPSGYTMYSAVDFENGTFGGGGAYGTGNFVTNNYHSDGNAGHNHSIECQYGGTHDCSGSIEWTRPLPVGTKEIYVSFYEWLDSSFRMNDEMFLMRLWWHTGTGQPCPWGCSGFIRENILDYFQNTSLAYNSTDAVLLNNIQGAPYYQNTLPGNGPSGTGQTLDYPFTLGQWVQHEVYYKFSTTSAAVSVPGTVTLNATAHTYTCSSCDWTALGVHVGDSPHFTGFSSSANNGDGTAGGGGYSYFVTSVTPTVITTSSMVYASNEGPISGATIQVDHADGAYRYLKNGVEIAHQNKMINPGKVDFSTQATNLSLLTSYSVNIWHTGPETSAPFNSACSTNHTGVGYDNLSGLFGSGQYGWNGAGLTATSQARANAGLFDTPIRCDATWAAVPGVPDAGHPMPTPPVFKRYLDDVIVLYNTTGTAGGGSGVGGGGYQEQTPPPATHSHIRLIRH